MSIPENLKYSATHQWARLESDGLITVGITDHAQQQLGDLVFVQAPDLGRELKQAEQCAVVESVKTASDVYSPVSGVVVAVNLELADEPEKINADPYAAWIFKLNPADREEIDTLLDAHAYRVIVGGEKS